MLFTVFVFRRLVPIGNVFCSVYRVVICFFGLFLSANCILVYFVLIRLRGPNRLSVRWLRGVLFNRFASGLQVREDRPFVGRFTNNVYVFKLLRLCFLVGPFFSGSFFR